MCLKNIRTFLQTCEKVFKVKSLDLFDPPDLFDVKNFRKVRLCSYHNESFKSMTLPFSGLNLGTTSREK